MLGGGPDTASLSRPYLEPVSGQCVCLLAPETWARDLPPLAVRLKASQAESSAPCCSCSLFQLWKLRQGLREKIPIY